MVFSRWFFFENIERRARNFTGFNGRLKSLFVNESAARAVDDSHAIFHFREGRRPDDAARFRCERRVYTDKVRACKHFIKRDEFDFGVARLIRGDERIEGNDFHSECSRARGDGATNTTETDDAERLTLQFYADERLAFPLA